MLKCRKCGAELAEGQRACLECGEATAAGGKFDYGEQKRFELTRNHILIVAGLVLLVIIVLVARGLRTIPPEQVAGEWFDAMLDRQMAVAHDYSTPTLEKELQSRMMDLRAVAEEYRIEVKDNRASFQVSEPVFDDPAKPRRAELTIRVTYPSGTVGREVQLQMVKVGRQWRVNRILS